MCYVARSEIRDLSFVCGWRAPSAGGSLWLAPTVSCAGEWKADVQWIPFDLPSAMEIETAFQAGKGEARLTCGFFEDKRAARAGPAAPDRPCAQRAT